MSRVDEAMRRAAGAAGARRGADAGADGRGSADRGHQRRRRRWRASRSRSRCRERRPRRRRREPSPASRRHAGSYDTRRAQAERRRRPRARCFERLDARARREDRRRPQHARRRRASSTGGWRPCCTTRTAPSGLQGRHGRERGGRRRQDADRVEPRAHAQRVVPEARAAHRRRPAAAVAAHGVPARHGARVSAMACCRPARRKMLGAAGVAAAGGAAGRPAELGSDGRPDLRPHAAAARRGARRRSTGSSSTRRRWCCCPTRTCSRRWSTARCWSSGRARRRTSWSSARSTPSARTRILGVVLNRAEATGDATTTTTSTTATASAEAPTSQAMIRFLVHRVRRAIARAGRRARRC